MNTERTEDYGSAKRNANLDQLFNNNSEIEKILNRYQNLCTEMDNEVANLYPIGKQQQQQEPY